MRDDTPFINERFIFVIGSDRSGTTYLADTLGRHPNLIHFPGETKFMPPFFLWLENLSYSRDTKLQLAASFLGRWLIAYKRSTHKKRLVEKTPANVYVVNWLADCFPKAQFIHIHRDPRDVVASLEKEISKPTIELAALFWVKHIRAILDKSHYLGDRFLSVSYEKMALTPVNIFTEIFQFLNEKPDPVLSYVQQSVQSNAVGRWMKSLSDAQVEVVEQICGELMQSLGYEKK